jgi:hypothetical protein
MNRQVKGGKVHRDAGRGKPYLCGLWKYSRRWPGVDKFTTKPVTCKNCLRAMKGGKG